MPVGAVEIYKNRLQQVTNLNTTLFQYPAILATITGGLWYFATQKLDSDPLVAARVFFFAAVVALLDAKLISRTNAYLTARLIDMEELEATSGLTFQVVTRGPATAWLMQIVMWSATLLSAGGVIIALCRVFRPAVAVCL
jgi:hypothetical protein